MGTGDELSTNLPLKQVTVQHRLSEISELVAGLNDLGGVIRKNLSPLEQQVDFVPVGSAKDECLPSNGTLWSQMIGIRDALKELSDSLVTIREMSARI